MIDRSNDIAVLKIDFMDYLITRVNVDERLSIGDKIGALGGIIGKNFENDIYSSRLIRKCKFFNMLCSHLFPYHILFVC